MNMEKSKILIIAIVIVLILVVIEIIIVLQPKKEMMTLMSKETKEIFHMKVPLNAKFPLINPKTGKPDLYPVQKFKCNRCGAEFYLIMGTEGRCPRCKSENITPIE